MIMLQIKVWHVVPIGQAISNCLKGTRRNNNGNKHRQKNNNAMPPKYPTQPQITQHRQKTGAKEKPATHQTTTKGNKTKIYDLGSCYPRPTDPDLNYNVCSNKSNVQHMRIKRYLAMSARYLTVVFTVGILFCLTYMQMHVDFKQKNKLIEKRESTYNLCMQQ